MTIIALSLCNARLIPLGGTILAMGILFGGINQAIVLTTIISVAGTEGRAKARCAGVKSSGLTPEHQRLLWA